MSALTPIPLPRKFLTPGVWVLVVLAAAGLLAGTYRFLLGLAASTNLNQFYPWGIWIVADVSFIALAAGGFTTAAVAHILHRRHYHVLARPALVTALLGYTCACILLAADLGRYYNIWHPILPSMWQGNSALFEVGMCVMTYLLVLYVEFLPIFCERFIGDAQRPTLAGVCRLTHKVVGKTMFFFLILGVGISCLHQSSLGHVMVLAPSKLHPLWWTPILAMLFLLSAIMAGFPTVIFASICAARALRVSPPMRALTQLATYLPLLISVYLAFKLGDLLVRGGFVYVADGSLQSVAYLAEVLIGLVLPLVLFMSQRVRRSPRGLVWASLAVMLGVILNRANVYWIGFLPANAPTMYRPSATEWVFTVGVLAAVALLWKLIAIYFPVITPLPRVRPT